MSLNAAFFFKFYRPFFAPEKPAASVKAEPTVAADSKSKGGASSPVGDVVCSVCEKIFTRQSVLNVHLQGPMLKNFLRPKFTNFLNKIERLSLASLKGLV
jgi:hypothetical protein